MNKTLKKKKKTQQNAHKEKQTRKNIILNKKIPVNKILFFLGGFKKKKSRTQHISLKSNKQINMQQKKENN